MAEACRPTFEGFEAEWEAVLSWREATTVVDHRLISCEHVPCLVILHLIVPVAGSSNILWAKVELIVLFRLTTGDVEVLSKNEIHQS